MNFYNRINQEGNVDHTTKQAWDAEKEYGDDQYIRVYFHLKVKGYRFDGNYWKWDDEASKAAFNRECSEVLQKHNILKKHGSRTEDFPMTFLWLNPDYICGVLPMNLVKTIAEELDSCSTITVNWVDLYEEVSPMSNEDFTAILEGQRPEIERDILAACVTSKKNVFRVTVNGYTVSECVGMKHHLPRRQALYAEDDSTSFGYVEEVLRTLLHDGFLLEGHCRAGTGYNTVIPTKPEQKRLQKEMEVTQERGWYVLPLMLGGNLLGFRVVVASEENVQYARNNLTWCKAEWVEREDDNENHIFSVTRIQPRKYKKGAV